MLYVNVTPLVRLPRTVEQSFTYHSDEALLVGQVVLVRFHGRKVLAIVRGSESNHPTFRTSPIEQILPFSLSKTQQLLANLIAREYGVPDSLAYSTIVPNLPRRVKIKSTDKILIHTNRGAKQLLGNNQHILLAGDYPNPVSQAVKDFVNHEAVKGQILILVPDHVSLNELQHHYPTALRWDTSNTSLSSKCWLRVASGEPIIIGTRNALFAPFNNLRAVVVSDSTSELFRSRDAQPHFNTISLAHQLSRQINCRVLLLQSQPTLAESTGFMVAKQKRSTSTLHILERRAYDSSEKRMPIATSLIDSINNSSGRILIIVNRRGYAALNCRECEYIHRCKKCDTPLTSPERSSSVLRCNHCGESDIAPDICPDCGSRTLVHMGFGIKRYKEYLSQNCSTRPIVEITGDINESFNKEWSSLRLLPDNAIILATAAILPRLWLLPAIHTSIIPRADHYLSLPSWRAAEDFLQMVNSIIARTISDTFVEINTTDYPAIRALQNGDYTSFWNEERQLRENRLLPPFGHSYFITTKQKLLLPKLPDGFTLVSEVITNNQTRTIISASKATDPTPLWSMLPSDAKVDVDPYSIV